MIGIDVFEPRIYTPIHIAGETFFLDLTDLLILKNKIKELEKKYGEIGTEEFDYQGICEKEID